MAVPFDLAMNGKIESFHFFDSSLHVLAGAR